MPNVAVVLKEEITRLARKEVKQQVAPLRKTIAEQRKTIAALRKQVAALERGQARIQREQGRQISSPTGSEGAPLPRFSPRWVKADRQRLELSAKDYASLVGVSMLTIYNWEQGKSKPRDSALRAWGGVRGMGKREAWKRLQEMDG